MLHVATSFQRMRSYVRQVFEGSRLHTYITRRRNRQVEPWNETEESKRAQRDEVVAVCLPINRIRVRGCLSGEGECEKILEMLEFYQDDGQFDKLEIVNAAIHHFVKSATYSYQGNWEHANESVLDEINLKSNCSFTRIIVPLP